ncbi:DUF5749 family beta-barrel protein [Geoglobus sp.]
MDLICRFVRKDGKEIGESIDVFDGYLIIKSSGSFFGVPLSAVREDGEVLEVQEYDEEEARKVGERWIEEKSKPVSLEELEKYGFGE